MLQLVRNHGNVFVKYPNKKVTKCTYPKHVNNLS